MKNEINEANLLKEGFNKSSWQDGDEQFTDYIKGDNPKVEVSGMTLVEINFGQGNYQTVPNCKNMDDVRALLKLFNI